MQLDLTGGSWPCRIRCCPSKGREQASLTPYLLLPSPHTEAFCTRWGLFFSSCSSLYSHLLSLACLWFWGLPWFPPLLSSCLQEGLQPLLPSVTLSEGLLLISKYQGAACPFSGDRKMVRKAKHVYTCVGVGVWEHENTVDVCECRHGVIIEGQICGWRYQIISKSTQTLDLRHPGKPPSCLQQPNQKAACYKAKLQEGHHLTETLSFIPQSDPEEAKGRLFTNC